MTKPRELPPRVFPKGRWYYLVTAQGEKRIWTKLTLIRDGLPELYRKLADLHARDIAPDRMPALIADWLKEVSAHRADKTQANDKWVTNAIAEAFADFRSSQVTPPDCATFLKSFRSKPRTHNEMRAGLRELMRYAEEKGYRPAGSNPLQSIKTMSTPARDRYPTDSEVRRVKVAAIKGADGKRTRMGLTVCLLIDLAYLTGQRIGDILNLRWHKLAAMDETGEVSAPYVAKEGLYFRPSKTAGSTGAKVLIEWTPRLKEAIERLRAMPRKNVTFVVTNQTGQRYDYEAFKSAWARALERSGVQNLHFHDLRAKALTDKEGTHGMQAARRMGAHSTEGQTAGYVRHRKAQRTEATK
jgi:integrase